MPSVPVHGGPPVPGEVHRVQQPDLRPGREVQVGGRTIQKGEGKYFCPPPLHLLLCQYAGPNLSELDHLEHHQKIPLTAYGRPGLASVVANLVQRQWAQLNLFRLVIVLNIAK